MPAIAPKVEAWDRWIAAAPESQNIEDRRDLDAIDMDEIYWRRARGEKGQLIQFPPSETDAKSAAQRRSRRDGENFDGEVSF